MSKYFHKFAFFKNSSAQKAFFLIAGIALVAAAFFSGRMSIDGDKGQDEIVDSGERPPEIEAILATTVLDEQVPHLRKLLARVGAEQAQEELYRSGMPFTGETHLLVHTIGDYVYEQYGSEAILYCRDYFLSACYHGALIHIIAELGFEGVVEAIEKCDSVHSSVAAQCSHAAGHGFLAWTDYELLESLALCDSVGEQASGFQPFNCYDGVFMENFWGVHGGEPSPKRWASTTDPHYPCNDPRIPEKYLGGCWANQATAMYQMFGGDLKKVAAGCDDVQDTQHRETCYHNFARQIHPLTLGQADKAFELCKNATGEAWQNFCLVTLVSAAFSVGDQDIMPFQLCAGIADSGREKCYDELFGLIGFYSYNLTRAQQLCGIITDQMMITKCLTIQENHF